MRPTPFALLFTLALAHQLGAQLIRLRNTETSPLVAHWRPPIFRAPDESAGGQSALSRVPANERSPPQLLEVKRRPPKAGNIIVRFDPDHEIQRLEYVMRDGRLATIYSRPQRTAAGQQQQQAVQPRQKPVDGERARAPSEQQTKQQEVAAGDNSTPEATIDLDENEFESADELAEQSDEAAEMGEVLATVAGGVVRNGYQANEAKLLKARAFVSKIKSKFKQLPQLISRKLLAKSSPGKVYLDHATGPQEHSGGPLHLQEAAVDPQSPGASINLQLDQLDSMRRLHSQEQSGASIVRPELSSHQLKAGENQ